MKKLIAPALIAFLTSTGTAIAEANQTTETDEMKLAKWGCFKTTAEFARELYPHVKFDVTKYQDVSNPHMPSIFLGLDWMREDADGAVTEHKATCEVRDGNIIYFTIDGKTLVEAF